MILDVWFAVGGILGAIVRRWRATDEASDWTRYGADAAVAALGGPLLSMIGVQLGLIDQATIDGLTANWVRAIAIGAVPAFAGLELLTSFSARWAGKPTPPAP